MKTDREAADIEELARVALEMQREADEFQAWLHSPEGKVWVDQEIREINEIVEKFQMECADGKYALAPDELEQICRDGVFMSHRKKGGANE